MDTLTLFDFAVAGMKAQAEVDKLCHQPIAHTQDPQTSFDAGQKMIDSGKMSEQEAQVFGWIEDYLQIHPRAKDFTARELAMWRHANKYHVIQRRLSGLRVKGKIKRTSEKREGYCVWRILWNKNLSV